MDQQTIQFYSFIAFIVTGCITITIFTCIILDTNQKNK